MATPITATATPSLARKKPEETEPICWSAHERYPLSTTAPFNKKGSQVDTLTGLFLWACKRYARKKCLAFRRIIDKVNEVVELHEVTHSEKGQFENDHEPEALSLAKLSDWTWMTYEEVETKVKNLAYGLRFSLPEQDSRIHMFADNSAQWFMISHAAAAIGFSVIGVNTKLGSTDLTTTLAELKPSVVFTEASFLPQLLAPLVECPNVKLIVYHLNSDAKRAQDACLDAIELLRTGLGETVKVMSVEDLEEKGKAVSGYHIPFEEVRRTERPGGGVWGISYPRSLNQKSQPKAVTFTHEKIFASVIGFYHVLESDIRSDDSYLTHVPLYSNLEYSFVNALFLCGVPVGFATSVQRYLLDFPISKKVHASCEGDIRSFSPTIFTGIRPWWSEVHGHMLDEIKKWSPQTTEAFWSWINKKKFMIDNGMAFGPAMRCFDNKAGVSELRKMFMGGRIRWIINHCSMTAPEGREFLGLVLGGENGIMTEGWSIMEKNTPVTFMTPAMCKYKGVGRPLPTLEIKLVEEPGTTFRLSSKEFRGRVYVRGPSVPDTNSQTWLQTTKIGQWDSANRVFRLAEELRGIKDRHLGDYMPHKNLEDALQKTQFIRDCMLIHTAQRLLPVAVITVDEKGLRDFIIEHFGTPQTTMEFEEILLRKDFKKRVTKHLCEVGRKEGLCSFELVSGVVMIDGSFTIQNGLRHPDGRINRGQIMAVYGAEIKYECM